MWANCFPYSFDLDKFVAVMTYLAERVPDLTKLRAAKLLYFADKYHLTHYGRLIIGDMYVRMDHGPVPSRLLGLTDDLVNPVAAFGMDHPTADLLKSYLTVEKSGDYPRFKAVKSPDMSVLSESDVEALDKVISEFGNVPISVVWNAGHRERSWQQTPGNQIIDYRLLFDENNPDQMELLSMLDESAEVEERLDAGLRREKTLA